MTAPDARPSGFDGNARGLLVLVAALLVGFLLLLNAGDGGETAATSDATTSTIDLGGVDAPDETTGTDDTTTTSSEPEAVSRPPSEVQVIVLNGSGVTGAAAVTSTTIGQGGYEMLPEGNGPTTETTTVYFADDYQAEATAIALLLGKTPDVVTALSEASLGGAESSANVVVVLGADTPPVGDGATTTTGT